MICVDAESIGVRVADKDLFTEVSLTVRRGDRVAVIGVNGTGKSTLLRVLAGVQEPDSGTIRFGRGLRPYGRLPCRRVSRGLLFSRACLV
jgi:ATP-binding cassette subfamily F protein uup